MKLIIYFFFLILVFIISILPFFLLYGFSNFMRFIMKTIVTYRVNVINANIKKAFPKKTQAEVNTIAKQAYKNLIDYIVEGIKVFTMSKRSIIKQHKVLNPELINQYYNNNDSIIIVTAHYNNWEWGSLSASLQTPYKAVAFYKPLSNKYIDAFLRKSRQRCGTELISIYETSKTFEKNQNHPYIYLMAADQSPSGRELPKAHWVDFLGIKTPFLHGFEKHARINNYPVFYVDIQRIKRGKYELSLSLLSDKPNNLPEGELTKMYAKKLESIIKKDPANWLWSHKRWKHAWTSIGSNE